MSELLKQFGGSFVGFLIAAVLWRVIASRIRGGARSRRQALEQAGREYGLELREDIESSLRSLPFQLFSRGMPGSVTNPLHGTRDGREVVVADYFFASESNKPMRPKKRVRRVSMALTNIGANLPRVRIEQQTMELQARDLVRDDAITFESERFNRRFAVRSDDRRFAYLLVDARMIAWLLDHGGDYCYEVHGPWVLAYGPQVAPRDLGTVVEHVASFVARIPRTVWEDSA